MTQLYAQPYDLSARGFFFETAEDFREKAATCRNEVGENVEEFEIQFVEGERIDAELAAAIGLHQGSAAAFLACIERWSDYQKLAVIIAAGECGDFFDLTRDDPDDLDIDLYPGETLREFAGVCLDEGWFGPVPEAIRCYIDIDAVARDLALDYGVATIAGEPCVYRCG